MHGIKKTPASEAQLAEIKKERTRKVEQFLAAKKLAFQKRDEQVYDETLLEVTAEIVKTQPNFYTIWNIRRKVFEVLKEKKDNETTEEYLQRLVKLYENELDVSQHALVESDPKCYSAWYHRGYILQTHPQPNYNKELQLCELALSRDARNFHCWDHRRFVAKLANLDEHEELEFSNRLVGRNPSNYSAWHYRGTLLPKVRPNPNCNPVGINDETMSEEMEKIKTFACVNTEDQTAWTYIRWLSEASCVGPVEQPCVIAAKPVDIGIFFHFSLAVNEDFVQKISIFNAPTMKAYHSSKLWFVQFFATFVFPLEMELGTNEGVQIINVNQTGFIAKQYISDIYLKRNLQITETTKKNLEELIVFCMELMKEEDNPWETLSLARTLFLLNGPGKKTAEQVLGHLRKVSKLDFQRKNVYYELADNVKIASYLVQTEDASTLLSRMLCGQEECIDLIDLELRNLSQLYPLATTIRSLNLQRNLVQNTKQFQPFQMLEELILDDNQVTRLNHTLHLPVLKFLSLARNPISSASAIFNILKIAPNLERLLICETPLSKDDNELSKIKKHFEESGVTIKLFIHYI